MRKITVIFLVLILVLTFFTLAGCNSSGDKGSRYQAYSDAISAGLETQSFYVKYSTSAEPEVTYKLNYSVESGKIAAVFDKEMNNAVSVSHEYIYFGHALPQNVKEKDASDSDYRLALFKGDEAPRFDVTAEDFLNMPEISRFVPKNILGALQLTQEQLIPVDGVDFSVTQGVTETFSFTVADPENPYFAYCSDGNYLIVRAIQKRVNKITDRKGTFSAVIDYVGPNVIMPAF